MKSVILGYQPDLADELLEQLKGAAKRFPWSIALELLFLLRLPVLPQSSSTSKFLWACGLFLQS